MHPNEKLLHDFYSALQRKDYRVMQKSYHPQATYNDPVFGDLDTGQARAMWQMLLTSAKDLQVKYGEPRGDDTAGSCHWEASYTFSGTGRKVNNSIKSRFEFRDGLIYRHEDHFNFWRWASMALGGPGMVMGWSPYLLHAVQKKVKDRLQKFMSQSSAA